ncbi:unnamed protein product [Closterium sp. NIES-54]
MRVDHVSLFYVASRAATAPPATADSSTRSQWLTRDAAARLAIRNHLPLAECAHFGQHRTAQALYDAVVARYSSPPTAALGHLLLPYLFPELSAFATVEDLVSHLCASDARYRAAIPAEFLDRNPAPMYITLYFIVTRLPDSLCSGGSGGGGGGSGSGGGGSSGGGGGGGTVGGSEGSGGGGGGSGGSGGSGGGGTGSSGTGARRAGFGGGQRQQGSCPYVIRTGDRAGQTCGRLHTQHSCFSCLDDAWRAEFGDDVELPRWADLLKSRIAIFDIDFDAILSATYALSVSAEGDCHRCVPPNPGIAAAALGASESGTLPGTAPAEALHTFTLDSGASHCFFRDSTTLTPQPAPVLVRLADPSGGPVVARSSTVLPCPAVAASCSCRLLSHQTLLWHHRLGHPSLPRLRGMHSRLLVSALPRSLPPLLPSPAPPCLPCVEGRQLAAPHSSSFPPTIAPLQTLHMDVWGPSRLSGQSRECYFLLVVDDYTRYTTVFPLRSKGQVLDVLIPWICTVRLQLRERFGQDLPVLRLHSDLLREFCRGEGILQSFTLPDSPQQNGIAERRIGLVMEYVAHQLNLWPRVSLPETSPTLRWTGEVGDASVFRVWGSRAFVRDTSADKLSPRAIPCDVTFDESLPFYHLFPYRSTPPLPPPLFLAPGPPPVDPLLPQGPAPSGVSQVDPLPSPVPVQVVVGSGAARGAASGGAASGGAEPVGAGSEGGETGGAEPGGVGTRGAQPGGAEPEGVEPGGAASEGAESGGAEPQGAASSRATGAGGAGAAGAGGAGVAARASGAGGAVAPGPGGARTRGTGVVGTSGVEGAGVVGPGAGGAGAAGSGVGGTGAGGTGAVDPCAGGAGGTVRPRPYFVPLLQQPASPLPTPSPYTEQSGGFTERREPASRPVSPIRTTLRAPRSRPPPVPGTHSMALRPSSVPLRVSLPAPSESSLPEVPDPESDRARAVCLAVSRLVATAVTDPSFASAAASALVAELLDFVAACQLHNASDLVAESASAGPPSVGGECALGTDILEDRQEEFECLPAVVPRFTSILLAPEGDPDAPDIPTPHSYAEAITGPYTSQWQAAMDVKMASWKSTGTYVDKVPPPGANIVDGMWIFRVKRPPGSPPAFKARYVARGFSPRQGVDYFQTFSPTPKMTTLRVLLHVAAQRDYELHSLDFITTFLQGSLHKEIWLRRPPGFTGTFPADTQWSLRRPVYGLRQAPRKWHNTLRTTLAALGFAPSTADPLLFLRTDTSLPPFYVLVCVDDLVFATADTEALTLVKSELQKRHTCTDLGELHSYLGLQITRDRAWRTITLTRSHMVHQVLQRFGFQFSLPQPTPLSTSHSLSAPPSDESVEPSGPYPELVGCLMYLMTCTRPDLAYPLSLLARYVAPGRHRKVHWDAVKRVLRYLCSTSGMGLMLGGRGPVVLTDHADAFWVDDSATQRSSQGYTFSLGSGSVSWRSTRSSSVLSFSCEAEIYAGAMAAQELLWLTYFLTDLGEQPRSPPILYVDNKAMIALCQEHRLEHRTKHIALRYFLARELQQRGQLCLAYVATLANTADVFTKALRLDIRSEDIRSRISSRRYPPEDIRCKDIRPRMSARGFPPSDTRCEDIRFKDIRSEDILPRISARGYPLRGCPPEDILSEH